MLWLLHLLLHLIQLILQHQEMLLIQRIGNLLWSPLLAPINPCLRIDSSFHGRRGLNDVPLQLDPDDFSSRYVIRLLFILTAPLSSCLSSPCTYWTFKGASISKFFMKTVFFFFLKYDITCYVLSVSLFLWNPSDLGVVKSDLVGRINGFSRKNCLNINTYES